MHFLTVPEFNKAIHEEMTKRHGENNVSTSFGFPTLNYQGIDTAVGLFDEMDNVLHVQLVNAYNSESLNFNNNRESIAHIVDRVEQFCAETSEIPLKESMVIHDVFEESHHAMDILSENNDFNATIHGNKNL